MAGLSEALASAVSAAQVAAQEPAWRAGEAELVGALSAVEDLRRLIQQVQVAVVTDISQRGMPAQEGMSLPDYVALRCPWLSRREINQLARVCQQARKPRNHVVADAIESGELSVERADGLFRALGRVEPFVGDADYVEASELLLPLAEAGAEKEVRRAAEHLAELVTPELTNEQLASAKHDSRTVYESSLATGMKRFIIEADPEGAAMVRSVLGSVLAKPAPDATGADLRSPGQRRYDALMTILERGMSNPEGVPTSARVSLLVTVPWDTLAGAVGSGAHGVGVGDHGAFTPGQLRRMACQAQILPAVLGTESEPLDLGRSRRLASTAQTRALYLRDGGCTFPGCSMPVQWTEVHHANVWWSRGGRTDLADMALLCRRHHTWVHAHDPAVTVTSTGPRWHVGRAQRGGNKGLARALHTELRTQQTPGEGEVNQRASKAGSGRVLTRSAPAQTRVAVGASGLGRVRRSGSPAVGRSAPTHAASRARWVKPAGELFQSPQRSSSGRSASATSVGRDKPP